MTPRQIAILNNEKKYVGKLCKNNHDNGTGQSIRYLHGGCVECTIKDSYTWRANNPDKLEQSNEKNYLKNREKIKNWAQKNPDKVAQHQRTYYLKNKDRFKAMREAKKNSQLGE